MTRSLTPAAALTALAAFLGAAYAVGAAPTWLGRPSAAFTLFLGLGWPLLARLSPVGTAWLKLLFFSALLAPVFALVGWIALRGLGCGPVAATAGVQLAGVGLAGLAVGGRVGCVAPGRAVLMSLVLALGLGALVAWVTLTSSAVRVSHHGLMHAGITYAVDRAVPPENPLLAGVTLSYYWAYHALGALLVRAAEVAPTRAFAWIGVWSAVTSTLALYFLAAPLFRSGRRELAAVLLASLGLSALGGWLWLVRGAPLSAPQTATELMFALDGAVRLGPDGAPLWERRVAFGLSKLFNASSHAPALALWLGGLAAAAHSLRGGLGIWLLLTGLLHGAAFLLNPVLGAAGLGCTALAAVLFGGTARAAVGTLVALGIGSAPGILAVLTAGGTGGLVHLGFEPGSVERLLAAVGPLLPPALLACLPLPLPRRDAGQRIILGLIATAGFLPLALYPFVELPLDNQYKLLRLSAGPLGLLAVAGLARTFARGGVWRVGAALWGLGLVVGATASNALGLASYGALARHELPLLEQGRALAPEDAGTPGLARDMASAYRLLRESAVVQDPGAILLLNPTRSELAFGPEERAHVFTEASNLQGHEAAAFAQLSLWCDRRSHLVDRDRECELRLKGVAALFGSHESDYAAHLAPLTGSGRPVVVLLTPEDEQRFRRGTSRSGASLAARFRSLGFAPFGQAGEVELLIWPPAQAARAGVQGVGE